MFIGGKNINNIECKFSFIIFSICLLIDCAIILFISNLKFNIFSIEIMIFIITMVLGFITILWGVYSSWSSCIIINKKIDATYSDIDEAAKKNRQQIINDLLVSREICNQNSNQRNFNCNKNVQEIRKSFKEVHKK